MNANQTPNPNLSQSRLSSGQSEGWEQYVPPEQHEAFREVRRRTHKRMAEVRRAMADGVPSSKVGRSIYYSKVGFWELPGVLLGNAFLFVIGASVWYADDGFRHITL